MVVIIVDAPVAANAVVGCSCWLLCLLLNAYRFVFVNRCASTAATNETKHCCGHVEKNKDT